MLMGITLRAWKPTKGQTLIIDDHRVWKNSVKPGTNALMIDLPCVRENRDEPAIPLAWTPARGKLPPPIELR